MQLPDIRITSGVPEASVLPLRFSHPIRSGCGPAQVAIFVQTLSKYLRYRSRLPSSIGIRPSVFQQPYRFQHPQATPAVSGTTQTPYLHEHSTVWVLTGSSPMRLVSTGWIHLVFAIPCTRVPHPPIPQSAFQARFNWMPHPDIQAISGATEAQAPQRRLLPPAGIGSQAPRAATSILTPS